MGEEIYCKNCGMLVTDLPHVCPEYNFPMLLQLRKEDVMIILKALICLRFNSIEDVDRVRVDNLINWLREQGEKEC